MRAACNNIMLLGIISLCVYSYMCVVTRYMCALMCVCVVYVYICVGVRTHAVCVKMYTCVNKLIEVKGALHFFLSYFMPYF